MNQTLRSIVLFSFLIFLTGCKKEKEVEISFEKQQFPKVIDEMSTQKMAYPSASWLAYAYNQPYYFGELRDTIKVNRSIADKSEYFDSGTTYANALTMKTASVGIKVDTSQIINTLGLKSNPVLIYNKTAASLFIGSEGRIYFVVEGKTRAGDWKPIEKHFFPFCGTGVISIILPPKKYALSAVVTYNGNFKTKLRIKMGVNYSNEFEGSINESQFESRYGIDGKEKTVPRNTSNKI